LFGQGGENIVVGRILGVILYSHPGSSPFFIVMNGGSAI
jgi:hypothetical protein